MQKCDFTLVAKWFTCLAALAPGAFRMEHSLMDLGQIGALLARRQPGHALPQALYTSVEAFEFDLAAIYAQSWLMAGMACEVASPGSYLALTVGRYPVIVVRDRKGTLRAFHNACRHRGSLLCQPGHGAAPKLVCPYHRWTYDLDGSLFAAARMPDDFDKAAHGLKEVALREVAGALFICLADDPPQFDSFAAHFAHYAAPLNFGSMKLAASDTMVEYANWKLVMENARECYHCSTGHPELARSFPANMTAHFDPATDPGARAFAARMDAAGLPHAAIEGPWWQIARFALNPGCTTLSMDGQPLVGKRLTEAGDGDIGSLRWALDPHLFAHATADHLFTFNCVPMGPNETHVHSRWYVHQDAVEGVDYTVPALTELWLKTNAQDKQLAENNQQGVFSPGYTPGPYSPEAELLVARFTDWYCERAAAYCAAHG